MIVDGILLILQGIVNVLLAPLEVINIGYRKGFGCGGSRTHE